MFLGSKMVVCPNVTSAFTAICAKFPEAFLPPQSWTP